MCSLCIYTKNITQRIFGFTQRKKEVLKEKEESMKMKEKKGKACTGNKGGSN